MTSENSLSVLHVYRTYFPDPPGGLQEAIRQICLATGRHGVRNTIFTLSPNPQPYEIDFPEGRVVRRRSWAAPASCDLGDAGALLRFRQLANSADVIHYQFPWPFADVLHLLAQPRRPAIVTYQSDIVRQRRLGSLYRPLMFRFLRSMSAIVATSPVYARTSPVLTDPSVSGRVRAIPLGIDDHAGAAPDAAVLERLGLNDGSPFILFIGVLRYYKGLHSLVDAATRINARIVIAGSGPEGESLRARMNRVGAGNLIFAGQVTDAEKTALLAACRAFVLPSHLRSEAFGMVLVEAAMHGKPMVTCEIGSGTSFVNCDQETGFVVPPESPSDLASAINRLIEDDALCERFGRAARLRYERLFSSDALGKAYADLYREVARK